MFDIGFWELLFIGVIALLVVGPERLPGLAYRAGRGFGRMQRFLRKVRFQIENELHEHELRDSLKDQRERLDETRSLLEESRRELQQAFTDAGRRAENPDPDRDEKKKPQAKD